VARTRDELTAALANAIDDQIKQGRTTLIEAKLN
jgi:hypothetical protein